MKRNRYKNIVFAKGYKESLANFKKQFANDFHFRKLPKSRKDKEMEKAWEIATKGNNPPKPKKKSDGLPKSDTERKDADKGSDPKPGTDIPGESIK